MTTFAPRRLWVLALLLAALLGRAAVPQGYMPTSDGAGGILVRICGEQSSLVIPLKRIPHENPGQTGANDHPCAFAAAGALGPAPTAFVNFAALPVEQRRDATNRFWTLAHSQPAVRPPSRGPPATA